MNQARQGMKMESVSGGSPAMRSAMQPGMQSAGMSGQVRSLLTLSITHAHGMWMANPVTAWTLVCLQPGFMNPQMMAQRSRENMMRRQRMIMLMQQQQNQVAAGGFSPPPNVTAPGGMESPMGGPSMNQPGQQGFNYGSSYGELSDAETCCWQHFYPIPPVSASLFGCGCRDEPAGGLYFHGPR